MKIKMCWTSLKIALEEVAASCIKATSSRSITSPTRPKTLFKTLMQLKNLETMIFLTGGTTLRLTRNLTQQQLKRTKRSCNRSKTWIK